MTVRDDGTGFDPSRATVARHGLLGMRYRLGAEHGRLEIESRPGAGTTLAAVLPQHAVAAGDAERLVELPAVAPGSGDPSIAPA